MRIVLAAFIFLGLILMPVPAGADAGGEWVAITAAAGAGGEVSPLSVHVRKGAQVRLSGLFRPKPAGEGEFGFWTDPAGGVIPGGVVTADTDMTVTAVFTIEIPEDKPLGSESEPAGAQSGFPAQWTAAIGWIMAGAAYSYRSNNARLAARPG